MKKIFILISLFLLWAHGSIAAMTCVDDGSVKIGNYGDYLLSTTCTFDTTPGTAVANIPSTIMDIISGRSFKPLYVYKFEIIPGSTGPTDNSDLQILTSDGVTILSASGNGKDVIHNSAVTSWIFGDGPVPGTDRAYPKGDGRSWIITVTNNAVNNSSFTLKMQVGP